MDSKRRQAVLLGALGIVLVAVVVWQFGPGTSAPAARPRATSAQRQAAAQSATAARGRGTAGAEAVLAPGALDVQLARLDAVAPEPAEATRDPFRFRPAAPPPPPPSPGGRPGNGGMTAPPVVVPVEPAGPPVPPPPPPISYKFIGTLTQGDTGRIAVLSDGKFVYHGREGDIIEGRYRVVKIGEESIQMEYVDGRGRQTIRLSGS
ncbi:MAG: hypothetical protein JNM38_23175 [Acidobacteria bacterium]|nr:hypothetical protein [Acidobacteriota bacterium]